MSEERPVRAPGLQKTRADAAFRFFCRPRALTRRSRRTEDAPRKVIAMKHSAFTLSLVSLFAGVAIGLALARLHPAGAETKAAGGVVHWSAKEVAAAFEKGGMLLATGEYKVMAGHRDKGGIPEVHDADNDVFYIVDGEATFVVGGKVVDPKVESPGETRGSRIEGGQSLKLAKGDVIVIPRGVPHWFSEVPRMVNYFVVKATTVKKAE
jgi:quercetin dioxygenase-like cupin family protein